MDRDRTLDIAVTGWSGRFPGAPSVEALWAALREGRVLTERRGRQALLAAGASPRLLADPDHVPVAGYLDDADRFDNGLFRITARDAELMDPQHRQMLETAWAALEDAGRLGGRARLRTGVYASTSGTPYLRAIVGSGPLDEATLEQALHGSEPDFLASLIAYKLDLTGPALAVQTACSSSLVSLHLAAQALLNGDCDQALVVAAGLNFPQAGHLHVPGGIKSAVGRCRPFDAEADGVVEGAGVVCVVLRRFADLQEDDPDPHGLILGSAVNNDGAAKAGYHAPSADGQRAVIERALAAAGVDAGALGYLETHGTATRLGDPIEWSAASEAYGRHGAGSGQIAIGALKGAIGHLDAAAGLAALVKALLVVRSGEVPPLPGFQQLNPLLPADGSPLRAPTGPEWTGPQPRRAGVSAFGIGGTNAHVIVEAPPAREARRRPQRPQLVTLSAADPEALGRGAQRLSSHLRATAADLGDLAYTLTHGRAVLPERLAVCARSAEEAADRLDRAPIRGRAGPLPPVVFMFPGQGAQHPGMARAYQILPGFDAALEAGLRALPDPELAARVRGALLDADFPAAALDETALAQPALFVLGYGAARALRGLGLEPAAVVGHSLGEIAAAAAAEVLTLEEAARFVTARGAAMQACGQGAMVAVGLDEATARALVARQGPGLTLAAVNTPQACVLAGSDEDVERVLASPPPGARLRRLRSGRAFHSPLIADSAPALAAAAAALSARPAARRWILGRCGGVVRPGETPPADYFVAQALAPVRFGDALSSLRAELPGAILLDLGPGAALAGMAQAMDLDGRPLNPGSGEEGLLETVGSLWAAGLPVALDLLCEGGRRLHAPTYAFRGPRWIAPEALRASEARPGPPSNPGRLDAGSGGIATPARSGDAPVDAAAALRALWGELLQINQVAESSDFFDLGGDSLLLINLTNRLRRETGLQAPAREMLAARTFGGQLTVVRRCLAQTAEAAPEPA